jgi:hypothetical protein
MAVAQEQKHRTKGVSRFSRDVSRSEAIVNLVAALMEQQAFIIILLEVSKSVSEEEVFS